jgi:hypothetical protein
MTITDIAALPQFPRAYTRPQLAEISALEERGVVVEGFVARLPANDRWRLPHSAHGGVAGPVP